MMLVYRWDIQRWSVGEVSAEWISRVPVTTSSPGIPPDVSSLSAGQLQLAAADPMQKLAFFNGSNLPSEVDTKSMQITPGGITFVNVTRPLVDSGAPSGEIATASSVLITTAAGDTILTASNTSAITVAMSNRSNYQEPETFGPEVAPNIMGECPQRSVGRYHRGRITISAGTWTTMAGLEISGIPAGLR